MVFYPVSLCHLSSFPLQSQTLLPLCCFHPLHRQQRKRKEKRFKNTFLSPENTAYILAIFLLVFFCSLDRILELYCFKAKKPGCISDGFLLSVLPYICQLLLQALSMDLALHRSPFLLRSSAWESILQVLSFSYRSMA